MKIYFYILVFCIYSATLWSQPTSLFTNKGASVYLTPGSYMIVNNDSLYNHKGLIQNAGDLRIVGTIFNDDSVTGGGAAANTGLYDIGGDWVNSGTVISYQDSVMLTGDAQMITGNSVTPFHHLILAGTSGTVKSQTIDATVDGILDLRDHELATQQNEMLVLNTSTTAITKAGGASGFVSSLGLGKLSRATNASSVYLYPTGTPSSITGLPFYYRPIDMTPASASANIYGVRLAHDPTADSYDVEKLDDSLCKVNPLYYHRIYHTQGADASNVKMYFDPSGDGFWTDMAHWGNAGNWNYMGVPTTGSGYGFSSLEIPNWSNFDPHPFALASKKFHLDAGPDQNVFLGQTVSLTPIIGTPNIQTVQWTPPTFLDFDNVQDPKATPTETTESTLTVTDKSGCVLKDSLKLTLLPDLLLIPTAFSPNTDGLNDIFRPLNKNLSKIAFQIFDRWGEKVYETDAVGEGWDGTYKGVKQPIGVYVWRAEYQIAGVNKSFSTSGNVTLVK